MEEKKNRYRVKFSKSEGMIFIGHLDLMRFFQKAIRRSGLPVSYSKGYSPHQIMSFASPLGVGKYTNGDYMDIELSEDIPTSLIYDRLSIVMTDGVKILNVVKLPDNAENAMASLYAAGYTVRFRDGHEDCLDTILARENDGDTNHRFNRFEEFMSLDKINYHKTTKKSEIDMDLKEGIYDHRVKNDEYVYLLINASSSGNIKPMHVIEAYADYVKVNRPREIDFIITREDMYLLNKNGKIVPMDDIKEEIQDEGDENERE